MLFRSSGTSSVDDVACQSHTVSVTQTSTNTRSETTYKFALIDSVSPGDNFAIEFCDQTQTITSNGTTTTNYVNKPVDGACPTGYTCSTSGTPYPTVAHGCTWSSGGTFWDGKLSVSCGYTSTSYDAQGAISYKSDISYGSIKIHHY